MWCSLFLFLTRKTIFWANLVKKIKIVSLSGNLVPRLIDYAEFNVDVHFFSFLPEIPFWANLSKKSKLSVQAKIKVKLKFK